MVYRFSLAVAALLIVSAAAYFYGAYLVGEPAEAVIKTMGVERGPGRPEAPAPEPAPGAGLPEAEIKSRVEALLAMLGGLGGAGPEAVHGTPALASGTVPAVARPEVGMSAVEELNSVLKLVPSHMDTKELVHLSELAARRMEEALERALVEKHRQKGIDYFLSDDMEEAIRVWDVVLKLDPGNKEAAEYKERAEAVMQRIEEIKRKNSGGQAPL